MVVKLERILRVYVQFTEFMSNPLLLLSTVNCELSVVRSVSEFGRFWIVVRPAQIAGYLILDFDQYVQNAGSISVIKQIEFSKLKFLNLMKEENFIVCNFITYC